MVYITAENAAELAHNLAEKARSKAGRPTDAEILERNVKDSLGISEIETVKVVEPDYVPEPSFLDDDEKQLIDESVSEATMCEELPISPKGEKTMDNSFPKYQYSVFLNGSRDEQLVIRADTFEEFQKLKQDANSILAWTTPRAVTNPPANPPQAAQPVYAPPANDPSVVKCNDCGAVMVEKSGVKDGKPWHGMFCPNADKNNRNVHKPIWLK